MFDMLKKFTWLKKKLCLFIFKVWESKHNKISDKNKFQFHVKVRE